MTRSELVDLCASSILLTTQLPSFSPSGLSLTPHHLISSPASYSASFPDHTLLLDRPPTAPYQSSSLPDLGATAYAETKGQAKRRKLQPSADWTPAQHLARRQREDAKAGQRMRTEVQTEARHAEVVDGLKAAWAAVREEWIATKGGRGDGWTGAVGEKVQWTEDGGTGEGIEVEWAGLVRDADVAATKEPIKLDAQTEGNLAAADLPERVIHNNTNETRHLNLVIPPPGAVTPADTVPYSTSAADGTAPDPKPTPPLPREATLLLPPGSSFLLASFERFSQPDSALLTFAQTLPAIDLVILEQVIPGLGRTPCTIRVLTRLHDAIRSPPWPNASVARSSSYETFDPYALGRFDLKSLLGEKPALVAVWLTNKVKFRRLVVDKLFPQWGITGGAAGEWHWVKITDGPVAEGEGGEPVWDWNSTHRRCYEGLVIGQYNPGGRHSFPPLLAATAFLSTPLGHSRKPVILDLLRPYLPARSPARPPNVVELFARTALAGPVAREKDGEEGRGTWLSVGNEACKFNVVNGEGVKGWVR